MNACLKLSFIIPFYNGKNFIGKCLDSLFNQDLSESEYEVIIVDDCSTDRESIDCIKEYCKKKSNIRIIRNKENLRCGGSRNEGLLNALGEYIWFVDQDDFIADNCLGSIMKIKPDNVDILYFDYCNVQEYNGGMYKKALVKHESSLVAGLEYIKQYCDNDFWGNQYDTNVWHALYRRDFLLKNNIFSPPVSYCEDMIVSLKAIVMAKTFKAIQADYYRYRNNSSSVYHTQVGVKGRPIFDASLFAGSQITSISELIPNSYDLLRNKMKMGGIYRINSFTKMLLKSGQKERIVFFDCIQKNERVLEICSPYLTPLNVWILNNRTIVCNAPILVFLCVKLNELLCTK